MNYKQNNLVVIVDDDKAMRESLSDYFHKISYHVKTYDSGEKILAKIDKLDANVIVCDLKMPTMNGLEVLNKLKFKPNMPPFILMTAHGDVPTAVNAMQNGAYDFIEKPFFPKDLKKIVDQAIVKYNLELDNKRLRRKLDEISALDQLLVGQSEAIQKLRQQIYSLANSDKNLLLVGEAGVEKDIIAKAIHLHSPQAQLPFIEVNCKITSKLLFESSFLGDDGAFLKAKQGVIFLDNLDGLPIESKRKLLPLLKDKLPTHHHTFSKNKVKNPRIISSAIKNPREFRKDTVINEICSRLDNFVIDIPPLRERADDIFELFNLYLKQFSNQYKTTIPPLSADDVSALSSYEWPGNQHQLKQIAQRFVLSNIHKNVSISHLLKVAPVGIVDITNKSNKNLRNLVQDFERQLITQALIECSGNIYQVCDLLKIPRRTLNEKLLKYKLSRLVFLQE